MSLPDASLALRLLREIASPPTAPFHEEGAAAAVERELRALGLAPSRDRWGNVVAERRAGGARHALALVAHLDHPAFDVVEANGRVGRARIRGVFRRWFPEPVRVVVHRDGAAIPARASGYVTDLELPNTSPGHVRLEADADLRVGDWATLDLPAFEATSDDVRMRAADDLAGCALILTALHLLASTGEAHRVFALFTRAEEPGLFGARLAAESGTLPRDALVVSIETSRALPGAEAGHGPVIRTGDYHHTFDDVAESYLRVARERLALARPPIAVQRQLMIGGTCEASAFLDAGYRTTGVALPVRNYHNGGPDGPAPEIVSLSDFRAGAALLVECALAAAADATEAYRVDTGAVPEPIRRLLG